jgi:transposase
MCNRDMVDVIFPRLAAVEVQQVERQGAVVRVVARSRGAPVACPACGTVTGKVHGYYQRCLAGTPVSGVPVVIELTLRRLVCTSLDCPRQTFREQVPGLAERYARRTPALAQVVGQVAIALAGRAGAALLAVLGVLISRTAVLSVLLALPEPARPAPAVVGVDDFAVARSRRYATVVIGALTRQCIDVLEDRLSVTFEAWLRAHPGVQVVCRDRSTAYAAAARDGAPDALQAADRWHIWKNLAEAVNKTAVAHRGCFSEPGCGSGRGEGPTARRIRARHAAVHALLNQGPSNGAIARRLHVPLNTVKKIRPGRACRAAHRRSRQRTTLVGPFRGYLRHRRAQEPDVPTWTLLEEIKAMGYQGGSTLLYRYLGQGRAGDGNPPPSPRRLTSWIMTDPASLTSTQRTRLEHTLKHCPQLKAAAAHVRAFAGLLTERRGQDLPQWIESVRADDLPALHSFAEGLLIDYDAIVAGLTLPYSNGPAEGIINKIKMLKRQMYGRAGFALLRKRILLA